MFKWLNKTGVESDRGFAVQSVDRFTIDYVEGVKRISVYVEPGLQAGKPCVNIQSTSFARWDGESTDLPLDRQKQMSANFIEAMEFQGIDVLVG